MPFVSVTRLHLASRWFLPVFIFRSLRISRQARLAPGFVKGWVGNDSEWAFWTATVWHDAQAMRAFRNSGPHARVMPKLLRLADEAVYVHWEQHHDEPPDPAAAFEQLARDGQISKVNAPSARQREGARVGSVMPRIGQRLVPRSNAIPDARGER